jgi:excinuclease UvrABC helicase subunit UvrB
VSDIMDYIIELEEHKKEAASNLEFEKAAKYRDQIVKLKKKIEGSEE